MKMNQIQKFILTVYGLSFMYFAIFHVPFKSKEDRGTIEYETIFSNNSDLLFGRLILIVVVISILASVLILLTKSVTFSNPISQVANRKNFVKIVAVILIFSAFAGYVYWTNRQAVLSTQSVATDSVIAVVDTTKNIVDTTRAATPEEIESWKQSRQNQYCNEKGAKKLFRSYMKFNYPDWPILSEPQTMPVSDCSYKIQFSTRDPHSSLSDKEVIVVLIRIVGDSYYVNTERGLLY